MENEQKIDFVLVYKKNVKTDDEKIRKKSEDDENLRKKYEESLINAGLILIYNEYPIVDEHFVIYICATNLILLQYAERLRLRMPIKPDKDKPVCQTEKAYTPCQRFLKNLCSFTKIDTKIFAKEKWTSTEEFSTNREYLFDVKSESFFTESQRSMIVSYVLELHSFENNVADEIKETGLKKLISDGVYSAAYPLHNETLQNNLLKEWGSAKKFYKEQPIDAIKNYFGVKIALYFAWLGFYTYMLIPVSIFGLFCFIYGWITMSSDQPTNDTCNPKLNITMCPLCDKECDYWPLTEACLYAKMTYLFDNYVTVIFSIVMSVWSSVYLNLWKNYSAEMIHRWGLSNIEPENIYPRPEYITRIKKLEKTLGESKRKTKICKVTAREEPTIPFIYKLPIMIGSYTVALICITILFGVLLSILVFRVSQVISEYLYSNEDDVTFRNVLVPITAAVLDLIVILFLNQVYDGIAVKLTKKEFWRTQAEFDNSLTLKIYVFQFINYYSGFFYIAFVKGRFIGRPGDYARPIFNDRLEECGPGGCLVELFIQLSVVMIGDQLWGQFVEYVLPYLRQKWIQNRISKENIKRNIKINDDVEKGNFKLNTNYNVIEWDIEGLKAIRRIDKNLKTSNLKTNQVRNVSGINKTKSSKNNDYNLVEWDIRGLFEEYLEIVSQYGFVTFFVTVFPLAPLCALLNNIVELRWDARKFLRDYRRPISENARNIGIWLNIIDWIGKLAIISNACIVAFTSNLIPRLVYSIGLEHQQEGFIEYSLAVFNTSDFGPEYSYLNSNVTVCRYPDYRNPPWHENPYRKSKRYWHVLASRIIFVLVYQNVVVLCKWFVKSLVPETSKKLKTQIMKEHYHLCKTIADHQAREKLIQQMNEKNEYNV